MLLKGWTLIWVRVSMTPWATRCEHTNDPRLFHTISNCWQQCLHIRHFWWAYMTGRFILFILIILLALYYLVDQNIFWFTYRNVFIFYSFTWVKLSYLIVFTVGLQQNIKVRREEKRLPGNSVKWKHTI